MLSEASLLSRGLAHDNLSKYGEVSGQITAIWAILQLNTPVSHGQRNEFLRPKMNSLSTLSRSSINSKLYLVGYNGELIEQSELDPYKHLKGFGTSTIDKLNFNHNDNHKSISIGRFIQESSSDSLYATHNCGTLPGSGGALMLDSEGNFAGIHIGVSKSRLNKKREMFFNNETYNRFISVFSESFRTFINQSILPNLNGSEPAQDWRFVWVQKTLNLI
ncbi:unnamed protein product [Didymodactylos carnosus]|uniref:Serine protease n=1 Tax=Didymodactylos carnosus TaxID=1234261 RepID=A0A8S2E6H3_9BILA|nr:unnamed protein product [Didymodactylos carnosus]CAF3930079.1 unnamed protein product [Didymodactylos carnosus]CAF4490086.1 unnamed protein product [Didymodactylos carnosus]